MAEHFLHGIELVEIEEGGRTVRTVKSSVIGLVGTAPGASSARTATLALGQGEAALTFTAKVPGVLGNSLRVQIRAATEPEAPLAVGLDTRTPGTTLINVTLATDLDGARISTTAEVAQALMAEPGIATLLSVAAGGDGGNGESPAVTPLDKKKEEALAPTGDRSANVAGTIVLVGIVAGKLDYLGLAGGVAGGVAA